jgi:invasion protein IalB
MSALAQTLPVAQPPAANGQKNAAQNQPTKTEQHGDWVLTCRKADAQAP